MAYKLLMMLCSFHRVNRMHRHSIVITIATTICLWSVGTLYAESFFVKAAGFGATPAEARSDAVRSALDHAIPQLIAAERLVSNDDVMINSIKSSANGYVDEISNERHSYDKLFGYKFEADFKLSTSRIETFLQFKGAQKSEIKGQELFANLQREKEKEEFFIQMIAGGFSTYGVEAFEVSVSDVNYLGSDQSLVVKFKISYNDHFLSSMETIIAELASLHKENDMESSEGSTTEFCVGFKCYLLPRYPYLKWYAKSLYERYPDMCPKYPRTFAFAFLDDDNNIVHARNGPYADTFFLGNLGPTLNLPRYGRSDQAAFDSSRRGLVLLGWESAYSRFGTGGGGNGTTRQIHFFDMELTSEYEIPVEHLRVDEITSAVGFVLVGWGTSLEQKNAMQASGYCGFNDIDTTSMLLKKRIKTSN